MPHALVAGATGIVGRRVAEHLAESGWRVTGLCRRPPQAPRPYALVSVDLTDAKSAAGRLADFDDVTHILYAARYDHPEGLSESVEVNAAMLRNLVDAVEPVAASLTHVHMVHGTKYYGHMLGPLAVPIPEDTPRAAGANFYFEHEDFIRERQRGKAWSYSMSRPHSFCDPDAGEPRNLALLLAVYASIARELGLPLGFPGTQKAYEARTQFTYVPLLARAVRWMATDERCANQAYNITNGDAPRWSELWPRFAEYFGVAPGGPGAMRLADFVADKDAAWQSLVRRHDLKASALASIVLWPYANYVFRPEWDIISDTHKARRDGFTHAVGSAQMFVELFDGFRESRFIP